MVPSGLTVFPLWENCRRVAGKAKGLGGLQRVAAVAALVVAAERSVLRATQRTSALFSRRYLEPPRVISGNRWAFDKATDRYRVRTSLWPDTVPLTSAAVRVGTAQGFGVACEA
jgi:hypothetical protein